MPFARTVEYESREQAYRRFREMFSSSPDAVASVRPDSLPASFRVTPAPGRNAAVADGTRRLPGVSDVIDECAMTR